MYHLRDLILDMRGPRCTLNLRQVAHCPCQDIHKTGLTGSVIRTVMGSKPVDKGTCKVCFTIHEHPLRGHKHILKDDNSFPTDRSERRLANIDPFHLVAPVITRLAAKDHGDARVVSRYGADNCIVF